MTPQSAGTQVERATVEVAAVAGPDELARNLIVADERDVPAPWAGAERVRIDASTLDEPATAVITLRQAAIERRRLVVVAPPSFLDSAPDERIDRPLHELGPQFTFVLDELHHLVHANAIDARDPARPRWQLLDHALALGARQTSPGEPGDVIAPDGSPLWLDGGPVAAHAPLDGVPVVHAVAVEHGALAPPRTNDNHAALAADQLAAVTHSGGAARIIAPAGSGKTRVLTERARHLLVNWSLPAGAVSLVAFNKRARREMRERTPDLAGLQVRTLNSIALAIINGTPPFAPQPTTWRTIDEPAVRDILGRLVDVPRRRNTDPIAPWIDALGAIRLGLRDPGDVEADYDGDVDGLAAVWPRYRSALERDGVVDFDDQIYRALEVLVTRPDIRRAAQRACRVLLVDEFQDLTPAHVLLVRLLAAPGGAVFGVGDDDQTIYGYNGADPAWLIDFASLFPGSGDHPLEVNYRCPPDVIEAADRLLRHNRRRVPKTIRAPAGALAGALPEGPAESGLPSSSGELGLVTDTSGDPVAATVDVVVGALGAGASTRELAVLTRVNSLLAPVQVALGARGIAVNGGVGTEFVARTAVRAVLAWLRLAVTTSRDRFDGRDLMEALRRPSRPLHPRITEWVSERTDVEGLRRLAGRLKAERDAERVNDFADDIIKVQALTKRGATTEQLVATVVDDLGLKRSVATLDNQRRGMNRAAQSDDLTALRQLARLQPSPGEFEPWLAERLRSGRSDDGVVLATVHRVKGQEWPHVVVHCASADQFPHRLATDIEEERRLFHVAITRTSHRTVVVTGEQPSPFVAELTTEPPAVIPAEAETTSLEPDTGRRRLEGDTPRDPLTDRSTVLAGAGLRLIDGGREWLVEAVDHTGALARQGEAVRRFGVGSKVETAGRQRGTLRVPGVGDPPAASIRVFDELRVLRERLRAGKPAYVVFDDKTLAAIATAQPATLDELAAIRGVGPTKLEQYGDEVLGVVSTVFGASDDDPTAADT